MTQPVQIAVVADDLTGALDAIAPFANRGLRCIVATSPQWLAQALAHPADVVTVSTGTREGDADSAHGIIGLVADLLVDVPRVIKKIDSRMKGHVGLEVATLAARRGLTRVLLCPAIPDMGRVVTAGQLCGFGVDPPMALAGHLSHGAGSRGAGMTVLVPDAETDAQIDDCLADAGPDTLLVGARGLTAGVARRMPGQPGPALRLRHPIGVAAGSRDPITLAQVADLRRSHPGAWYVPAPNGICDGPPSPGTVAGLAILQATAGAEPAPAPEVSRALADAFVAHVVPGCASLVLTGGETAAAVLAALGIGVMQVLGEVLPGLPLCEPMDFPGALRILTKSGGFGAQDVLSQIVKTDPNGARQT